MVELEVVKVVVGPPLVGAPPELPLAVQVNDAYVNPVAVGSRIFMLVLVTLSIPIHLRSAVVWSTHYITLFPPAYSVVEIPLFLGLSYLVARLKFE